MGESPFGRCLAERSTPTALKHPHLGASVCRSIPSPSRARLVARRVDSERSWRSCEDESIHSRGRGSTHSIHNNVFSRPRGDGHALPSPPSFRPPTLCPPAARHRIVRTAVPPIPLGQRNTFCVKRRHKAGKGRYILTHPGPGGSICTCPCPGLTPKTLDLGAFDLVS